MSTDNAGSVPLADIKPTAAGIAGGIVNITHHGLALFGLSVLVVAGMLAATPQLRTEGEVALRNWLHERHGAPAQLSSDAVVADSALEADNELMPIERATAVNPADLPKEQADVAYWISKKYKVAPEPLAALVQEAYEIGQQTKLEPTLLLAIMAVESSFNPFAQSPVGAQGLMQVMTKIHSDKYEHFGGMHAAFDPRTNLRVGVQVLQECIRRAGSLRGGLKYYVGAANLKGDGGYGDKVMQHFDQLYRVAKGKPLPRNYNVEPRLMTAQLLPPHTRPSKVAVNTTTTASSETLALQMPEASSKDVYKIHKDSAETVTLVSDALRYVSPTVEAPGERVAQVN